MRAACLSDWRGGWVDEGAALAPRAFREKLSKALDKLGGRYNLETSPGVRGNLQPAVQVCASGQRDAHYGAVLPALVVSICVEIKVLRRVHACSIAWRCRIRTRLTG